MTEPADTRRPRKLLVKSIFLTHARRIGLVRTALGGGLMYISFLEFVFLHLSVIVVLYQGLLAPLFRVRTFRIRDYLHFDRSRIAGMRAFDKLNCEFCAYANGTAKLWNDQIDALAAGSLGPGRLVRKAAALVYGAALVLFLAVTFVFSKVLFLVISLFLGLHRADTRAIGRRLADEGYAGSHRAPVRILLRWAKVYAESLAQNLEQIESGWCPLKHQEEAGSVFPDHHRNFFARDKAAEAVEALARDGSVSPRKPRY